MEAHLQSLEFERIRVPSQFAHVPQEVGLAFEIVDRDSNRVDTIVGIKEFHLLRLHAVRGDPEVRPHFTSEDLNHVVHRGEEISVAQRVPKV